jgi:DNA-directed RNA polymerase specialized sigma subunit
MKPKNDQVDLSEIVDGVSCFAAHKESRKACKKSSCRYWHNMDRKHQDCTILAAREGPYTLQDVGDMFNVTRMRICQIEKAAKQFLKTSCPKTLKELKKPYHDF